MINNRGLLNNTTTDSLKVENENEEKQTELKIYPVYVELNKIQYAGILPSVVLLLGQYRHFLCSKYGLWFIL